MLAAIKEVRDVFESMATTEWCVQAKALRDKASR